MSAISKALMVIGKITPM